MIDAPLVMAITQPDCIRRSLCGTLGHAVFGTTVAFRRRIARGYTPNTNRYAVSRIYGMVTIVMSRRGQIFWTLAVTVPVIIYFALRLELFGEQEWVVPNFHFFIVSLTSFVALFMAGLMV